MNNNYEEFVALRDKYRAITLHEIREAKYNKSLKKWLSWEEALKSLTGYGNRNTCTLCKAVGYIDTDDDDNNLYPSIDCDKCIWVIGTGSHCYGIENLDTFDAISNAGCAETVLEAFQNRANRMDEVLALYNKIGKETNTTIKLESDKCPYCGSYMTETLTETVEVDELISQCRCQECGGYYDDIYDVKYNHTICTTLPLKKYRLYTFEEFCTMGLINKAVKRKSDEAIGYISNYHTKTGRIEIKFSDDAVQYAFYELALDYTWLDGSPCGVEI